MTAKEKLTALADAVREKTGETASLSLDAMTALISALKVGGGLPSGIAMGEFVTTDETKGGDFSIEHGLGKMPNFVFIWTTATEHHNNCFRFVSVANLNEIYDDEIGEYYPKSNAQYSIADTASSFRNTPCSRNYYDNKDVFWLPDTLNRYYYPGIPYKWIAVRIEE